MRADQLPAGPRPHDDGTTPALGGEGEGEREAAIHNESADSDIMVILGRSQQCSKIADKERHQPCSENRYRYREIVELTKASPTPYLRDLGSLGAGRTMCWSDLYLSLPHPSPSLALWNRSHLVASPQSRHP